MAIENSPANLFRLFSAISPLLLSFFLVLSSLFNQDLKGLVYLAGVLISSFINIFLMNLVGSKRDINSESYTCDMFDISSGAYNSPAPTSLFIAFTIAYLLLPMKYNDNMNYIVVICLLGLFMLDAVTKISKKCTTGPGTFLGALVGLVMGSIWYTIFHYAGLDSLLYFDGLSSNRVLCSRPSKQTFKCSVYKNGEIISSNIV
jgi:hypothetical protein